MLEFKKKKWEDPFLAPSRPSYLLVSHVVRNVNYHCSEQHWQVAFESPCPFQFSPPRIIVLKSERCGTAVTVGIWMCEKLLQ